MLGIARNTAGTHVLLPWVIVTYRGRFVVRRVLEPAGQSLFGYHDPLVGPDEAGAIDWPAFWDAVHRNVRGCCDQALFRFVDPRYAQGPLSEPCGEESPVLDLSGLSDLDALLRRCSRSHRGDVHRQFRRLVDAGTPSLWIADAATVREALADLNTHFFPAIDAGWSRKPSGSIVGQPGMVDFLTRVVAEGVPAGWGHYSVLQVSGTPMAWHLGFLGNGGLYYWLPSYDSKWENLSPGKMLLAMLIKHAIDHGWPRIHLQTGGQPYKLAWQPTRLHLRALRWHAPTWRGAVLACWDAVHRPAAQVPLEP
jgi:CelD/BcsL family acetyltransferase involved in cellulose biosynthesis